jgi:hypothetical protein
MTTVMECRPRRESVIFSDITTFRINRHGVPCRTRGCSIVLSERWHGLVRIMRRIMEIAIIAFLNPSTLQLALGGTFGAGQLVLAVATAPALFASRSAQFHPTVTAPTAPVGVGWG